MSEATGATVLARIGAGICAALAAAALAGLWLAPGAQADSEFCPPGEAAAQCKPRVGELGTQRGLALDHESGVLYNADRINNRVEAFAEDGSFLFAFGWGVDTGAAELETCTEASGCQKGLAGAGAGELSKPDKVAVDNDPAGPNHHFVYVSEEGNARVQLFDVTSPPVEFVRSVGSSGTGEGQFSGTRSIGVGPAGVLDVLDNVSGKHRLQRFNAAGALIAPQCLLFEGGTAISLAVDSAGNVWVANEGPNRGIRKYDASCAPLLTAEGSEAIENNLVAVDEAGNPYAAQGEVRVGAGSFRIITAFDPASGAIERRYGYGRLPFGKPEGLAVRAGGEGGVFAAVNQEDFLLKRLEFAAATMPEPGPLPAPPSLEVSALGSARAEVAAEINPEGKASQARVEYLTEEEYEEQGESFAGALTKSTAPKALAGEDFLLKGFEAELGCPNPAVEALEAENDCLVPGTEYRWRVVATNAENPTGTDESTVEGLPFTTKEAPSRGELYATRVGVDVARLNAELNPTGIPAQGWFEYVDDAAYQADIKAAGDGFGAATLAPDVEAGQAPLDFGSGEGLITRQVTIAPLLPGTLYHYRLIVDSPLIEPTPGPVEELRTFNPPEAPPCANGGARIGAGAFLPDCRAYEMVSPVDKEGGDIRVRETTRGAPAVLEQGADSGEKLAYGSVRAFADAESAPFTSQYIAGRVAGLEWQTHAIDPPRGEPIFKPINQLDTELKALSADLCQGWLTTFAELAAPEPAGFLAGYSNLLRRNDQLCGAGAADRFEALAPLGAPAKLLGSEFVMEVLEISTDGAHAIFISPDRLLPEGSEETRQLYEGVRGEGLRFPCVLPGGAPVSDTCTAGSTTIAGDPGAQNGRLSADGERLFWSTPAGGEAKIYVRIGGAQTVAVSAGGEAQSGTSHSWFWGASANGATAVFSTIDIEAGISDLYEFDVEGEATEKIAGGILGVMGVSEDASRIYFASTNVLSEAPNGNGDKAEAGENNLYLRDGGGGIEFVARLAGADLTRALLPVVYLDHTARISPDGAHAAFVSVAPLTGYDNTGAQSGAPTAELYRYDAAAEELACVSCNPSGARPQGAAGIPFWLSPSHAARILSDEGSRLYFESDDALAARDTNGFTDVYQWEEEGTGGCGEDSASFSPASGGCVDLLSSGQSPIDSRFVEASPEGDDAFFATASSLLPQDPGVVDIYDARVNGGLPVPQTPPPPCEGDTCHAQVAPPEEPTPASSDYVAPPEGEAAKPAPPRCKRARHRAKRASGRAAKHSKRARRCRPRAGRAAR